MRKQPLTINLLINYIYDWYLETSVKKLKRSNIPVVTSTLEKKYYHTLAAVKMISTKFNKMMELRLKQLVFDLIRTINKEFHMKKRQAPFVSLEKFHTLTKELWTFVPKGKGFREYSKSLRQEAALHVLISAIAGGRWEDIGELRWEDIEHFRQPHGRYIKIMIRRSKNNLCNEQPQCVVLKYEPKLALTSCPVKLLKAMANQKPKPLKGRIFTSTSRSRLNVTKKMCDKHNIPFQGHSGRVSMAVSLRAYGFSKDQIRSYMNWKSDRMPDYYSNIRTMMAEDAPANIISNSEKLKLIQKTLI